MRKSGNKTLVKILDINICYSRQRGRVVKAPD